MELQGKTVAFLGDCTPDTFCGAVDFLMRLLQQRYPKSRLAFLTPIRRLGGEAPMTTPISCRMPGPWRTMPR